MRSRNGENSGKPPQWIVDDLAHSVFDTSVVADTTAPSVQVEIPSSLAEQNPLVYFDVIASHNVGVTPR
jgi:hypothetical protein